MSYGAINVQGVGTCIVCLFNSSTTNSPITPLQQMPSFTESQMCQIILCATSSAEAVAAKSAAKSKAIREEDFEFTLKMSVWEYTFISTTATASEIRIFATGVKGLSPDPRVDAVVGAAAQGLLDFNSTDLSPVQRFERPIIAGLESAATGYAANGVGAVGAMAGGGHPGYFVGAIGTTSALDGGFWPAYNKRYLGAVGY